MNLIVRCIITEISCTIHCSYWEKYDNSKCFVAKIKKVNL